jgi:hypothetical protein
MIIIIIISTNPSIIIIIITIIIIIIIIIILSSSSSLGVLDFIACPLEQLVDLILVGLHHRVPAKGHLGGQHLILL